MEAKNVAVWQLGIGDNVPCIILRIEGRSPASKVTFGIRRGGFLPSILMPWLGLYILIYSQLKKQ